MMAEQAAFEGPEESEKRTAAGKKIEKMAFEEALSELEGIVQKLERGQLSLEESITAYERGTLLRKHCEAKLKEAEARVEKLSIGVDGSMKTEAFDA